MNTLPRLPSDGILVGVNNGPTTDVSLSTFSYSDGTPTLMTYSGSEASRYVITGIYDTVGTTNLMQNVRQGMVYTCAHNVQAMKSFTVDTRGVS